MAEKYINLDKALAIFHDIHPLDYNTLAYRSQLSKIPVADVVEIVRCGECKHFLSVKVGCFLGVCRNNNLCHSEDWFCADGERKENKND